MNESILELELIATLQSSKENIVVTDGRDEAFGILTHA
jgi:hypothetical protein